MVWKIVAAVLVLAVILIGSIGCQQTESQIEIAQPAQPQPEPEQPETAQEPVQEPVQEPEPAQPEIKKEDIKAEFGIEVIGEIWNKNTVAGHKIGDYELTQDELLLVFNVLSSLPQGIIKDLKIITIVYSETPGAGGSYYSEEKRVIIFGTPDREEALYTARDSFISTLYHEIGHHVDSFLSSEKKKEFLDLYNQPRQEQDYASFYGMNYVWEDFATTFEEYLMNTEDLLKRASQSLVLKAKVEIIAELFSEEGRNYKYFVKNGNIIRWLDGVEEKWTYRSYGNPEIEKRLGF